MKGLVFGKTFERACSKLDDIRERYKLYRIDEQKVLKNSSEYRIIFENGDVWRAIPICRSFRGSRANVAYIDHEIEECYIPMIKACIEIGPWNAYNYY